MRITDITLTLFFVEGIPPAGYASHLSNTSGRWATPPTRFTRMASPTPISPFAKRCAAPSAMAIR